MFARFAVFLTVLVFALLVIGKFDASTGFCSLIRFGDERESWRHPRLHRVAIESVRGAGYDGQFYAQIALDPLLRTPQALVDSLDAPAYRARRILLPAAVSVIVGGRPAAVIQAYAVANIACWFAFALLMRRAIPLTGWADFARWFACVFSMGALESVRFSLVDLPATLMLCFAVTARLAQRSTTSLFLQIAGALTKETNVLGSAAINADWLLQKSAGRYFVTMIAISVPLLAWTFYVHWRLGITTSEIGQGNFTWPAVGGIEFARTCLGKIAEGNFDSRYTMGLVALVGFVTQIYFLSSRRTMTSPWWRIGIAYALLFFCLSSWVWTGYWAVARSVLPLTIAFNVLLTSQHRAFWPFWVLGNASILHAVWRFL